MNKYRQPFLDEESPGLDGPDYVALVIEWDDLADSFEEVTGRGTPTARRSGMSNPDRERDRVDQASMESFPASDPPSWGSSHAVADAAPEEISDEVTSQFAGGTRMSRARRLVLGLAAIVAMISMIEGLRRIRR